MRRSLSLIIILAALTVACLPIPTTQPTAQPTNRPSSPVSPTPAAALTPELVFVPDVGFRVENAVLPAPSVDGSGVVYLFYEEPGPPGKPGTRMVAAAADGLTFANARQPTAQDLAHHPFTVRLPDGAWRRYLCDQRTAEMKSESSTDGVTYWLDAGVRYQAQPGDHGTIGVYDVYVDPAGGVVLLYVGDMYGVNNVRRAYSPPGDNGWTFAFEDDNVLGDAGAGGTVHSFVDQKSILLPDGRRRLFVMKQGTLYSFISADGKTYAPEPGTRLAPRDFTGFTVITLHDPVVVRLPDGRYRMYVAARLAGSEFRWAIVSATTAKP